MSAHASDATIFDRIEHTRIQICMAVPTARLFHSPCPPEIYLPSKMYESRCWSQLSARRVFGKYKIRVLVKSRNPCKLSFNSGYTKVYSFYIFIRFQACYVAYHLKTSKRLRLKLSFYYHFLFHVNNLWWLNTDWKTDWKIRLRAVMTVFTFQSCNNVSRITFLFFCFFIIIII